MADRTGCGEVRRGTFVRTQREAWLWRLAALVCGLGYAAWACGPRVFDPGYLAWLTGDPATAYLGWGFLRAETAWHFPPTWVAGLGYPKGLSASFTDLVPIVALPLATLDRWLPRDFQYFGLLIALHAVLQAWFGFRLAGQLAGGRRLAALGGGLLLLLAPAFWQRFGGHFALSAHWILLAALLIYLQAGRPARWRGLLGVALLIWVAGGYNPYLLAMAALLLLAALWRQRLLRLMTWRRLAGLLLLGLLLALASLLVHGFLVLPLAPGDLGVGGYRTFSATLLALVDPMGQSRLVPWSGTAASRGEGFAYLGLGGGLLLALALPHLWTAWASWRDWLPLALLALAAFAFALSDRLTIGQHVLFTVELPRWIEPLTRFFRAAGRFVWPLHYALLLAGLWGLGRWRRRDLATALIWGLLALQLVELAPQRSHLAARFAPQPATPLQAPDWQNLGAGHAHLVVLPPWQCEPTHQPGGRLGYWIYGDLALRQGMTINSVYAARYGADFLAAHCEALSARLLDEGLAGDTAYVLDGDAARLLALLPSPGQWCSPIDGTVLCRNSGTGQGLSPALLATLFDVLPLDQSVGPLGATRFLAVPATPIGLAFRVPEEATAPLVLELACPGGALPPPGVVTLTVDGVRQAPPVAVALAPGRWRLPVGRLPPGGLAGVALAGLPGRLQDCAVTLALDQLARP